MPVANAFQTNFSVGELSPLLFARVDLSKYPNGCYELTNFIVQRFGGIKKRGGSEFIHSTKSNGQARLIPFIYSVTQAYVLEFGASYIRIYTNGGRVEDPPGTPIEVATPYSFADVEELQFAQSADVLYLAHPDHAPRRLVRNSSTSFTLEVMDFENGPYLELNKTSTTLAPADYASLTPIMTSDSTPSGTVTGTIGSPYLVFDKNAGTEVSVASGVTTGSITYQATSAVVVDHYFVIATDGSGTQFTPITWEVEASNDGSTWVSMDIRQGESGWSGGQKRFYEFANKVAYSYWRFRWLGTDGGNGTKIAEITFNCAAVSQTAFNLTASSTTGINDGQGFLTSDVGRNIRLLGSDGKWRWAVIQAHSSSTVVTVKIHGHAFPTLSPIANWAMGAWSPYTGYPACVGFYSGRLCFGRTATQPQTVWMSRVEDFTNFGVSDPLQDDDAIDVTIRAEQINEVKWLAESTDLVVGTTSSVRTIGPTSSAAAFSPTNIRQKRETNYGASDVQPVRVGQTALYSGYYRVDVREIAYSFEFNGYVSTDLSILSEHLPGVNRVKYMGYQQTPASVVWMPTDTGVLAGMTYERDQEVVAFHKHTFLPAGSLVTSVATIPGADGDEVWLVIQRIINGSTVRYIERLNEGITQTGTLASAKFLDSYLTYSGSSTSTLSGLSHLEGQSVYVWNGNKQGPFTVSSGAISLTSPITSGIVGLPYTSTMQTVSPEAAAAQGTAQTREGRISEVFVRLNRSIHGKIGPSDGTLETIDYSKSTDNTGGYGTGLELFTGDVRVPISMQWNRQKRIKLEHSEPTPFHCLGLVSEIRTNG